MKEGYIQEPPSRFVQDQTSAEQNTSQIPLAAVTLVSAPAFGSAQAPQASQSPQHTASICLVTSTPLSTSYFGFAQHIILRLRSVQRFDEFSCRETRK